MKTLTVEGDLTTVDTRTAINTQGSVSVPSLITPAGVKSIKRIIVAASQEGLAAGSATFFLRIGGSAVQRGEQTIAISAGGTIAVQSGSDAAPCVNRAVQYEDTDIDVSPSDTITIAAEMAGQDLGTAHIVVTLIFE